MDKSKEILNKNVTATSVNTNNTNTNNESIDNETNLVNEYIGQLTPLQLKAYEIAKEHLKTSFDITRSNGYNEWLHSVRK